VGPAGYAAAVLLAHWTGVARQLLQLQLRIPPLLVRQLDIANRGLQLGALLGELCDCFCATFLSLYHRYFCHFV
jgi:hypothetical protein